MARPQLQCLGALRLTADLPRQGYDDAFAESIDEDASYDEPG